MAARWLTYSRLAKIALVVLAPIAVYLGLRRHAGARPRAAVWVELLGAPPGGRYRPRTPVFDGARGRVSTSAARGETVILVVRVTATRGALRKVRLTTGELHSRYQRRGVVRARFFREKGGALVPAEPADVEAGKTRTWLLEIAVSPTSPPGLFAGALRVEEGAGELTGLQLRIRIHPFGLLPPPLRAVARPPATEPERAFLRGLRIEVGQPPSGAVRAGDQPRRAAWKALAGGAPALDLGAAATLVQTVAGAPRATVRAWMVRRALQDLSYLRALRAKGDPMAARLLARMLGSPRSDASAWEQARRELAGLLRAPNRRGH